MESVRHLICFGLLIGAFTAMLTTNAVAVERLDTQPIAASGHYELFRRARVQIDVAADPKFAGEKVVIKDGRRILGSGQLVASGKDAAATIFLPMPEHGKNYGPLSVKVNRVKAATVTLPNAELARQREMYEMPLKFDTYVFDGEKLPNCEFVDPVAVEELIGHYTIRTRFFDADRTEVTAAKKAGRYGAVVEVVGEEGQIHRRFVTLYRQEKNINWWDSDLRAECALPEGTGIDPEVIKARSGVLADYTKGRFINALSESEDSSITFAGLHERVSNPAISTGQQNRDWWFACRKQLGLVEHHYETLLPRGYADHPDSRYPLMIFLHGSGERGVDTTILRGWGPWKYLESHTELACILVSPQCPPNARWDGNDVNDLLDEIIAKYRVDPDRVYVTGLSLGGFGTWLAAAVHPERYAAIAPICGGGDSYMAANVKNVPTWAFHGAKDDIVPIKWDQGMVDALKAAGGDVRFTIYPDLGHYCWDRTYSDPDLYKWLFSQRRHQP